MTNKARGEVAHEFLVKGKKQSIDFAMTIGATSMLQEMQGKELSDNIDGMFAILAAMTEGTKTEKTAAQMRAFPITIVEFQDIVMKVKDATADASKRGQVGNENRQQRRKKAAASRKKKST